MKKLPIRPFLSVATLCMAPAVMGAEMTDALQFRATVGIEHDSNVLRVPSALGPVSDQVGIAALGLKVDKRYGLQRFRGDVEAATYRYRDLTGLNYSTVNYAAAWDWSITPAFHGVLSADRRQFREVTTDSVSGTNRIGRRTQRTELVEGVYEIDGAWRALAGLAHTRSISTDPNSYDASPSVRTKHVGAGYEFASGSSLHLRVKRGDGEYTALTTPGPTDFRDEEVELLAKWPVTGKTALEGRLAHIERSHPGAPARDFSGLVGNLSASWDITGKTRLIAAVSRDLGATGQSLGGHVESNRIYIAPVWRATAKTAVSLRYERTTRRWRDTPAGAPDAGRKETIEVLAAGLDWEPVRAITVSPSLRREKLKSSIATTGYRATVIGVAVKAYF